MNSEDTRNLFLAIALSVLVMAGWQYFFAGPLAQRQHQAQMQTQSQTVQSPSAEQPAKGAQPPPTGIVAPGVAAAPGAAATATIAEALAATPRVAIDTPSLGGSIDLKGGKLDDLVLKDYHETVRQKEPAGPSVLAERRAGRLLGDLRLHRRSAGGPKTPDSATRVWTAN